VVTRGFIPGTKRLKREADYSSPSRAEIKNAWNCTSTPHASSWRGALLSLYILQGAGIESSVERLGFGLDSRRMGIRYLAGTRDYFI
jgi:hypothetical protein